MEGWEPRRCSSGPISAPARWKQETSAADQVDFARLLPPGGGLWWGQAGAEPEPLVNAFLDQADRLGPLRAFCGLTWNERLAGGLPSDLRVLSYGGLGQLRELSRQGLLDVVPCHYSSIPRMFARGQLPTDLGLVQVSPPGPDGLVSLGVGVDYVADAVLHTRSLVAEVNHRMPATLGAVRLRMDRFAAVVETDRPLRELVARAPDEVDRRIAAHVASLVEDGNTIQMGVGTLPDAVLEALSSHRDLGVHTGMITDGVLALVEQGVVTGARKEIDRGLVVTGAALGTAAGYDRLVHLPVEFRAASYTHSPAVLSQLQGLVSINSAIEVDLLAQVGAELSRGVHLGALGGQVDFSRAAALTGARSVIALRSEVNGDSTIVTALRDGVVTTARADIDAVVTEHGIASLAGCTTLQRAERLIAVAAPQHREALLRGLSEWPTSAVGPAGSL
ncbi:MAG: putative 4-hydroxybutyrate CoA-transferase [Frankiales bacterium]|nr:putative 4-hydroxybutyrate CoA-transferase [Frankiales bacterium]